MQIISNILPIALVVVSILMIITILLQQSGAGAGAAFGGSDDASGNVSTRRGAEKSLLKITIVLATLFFGLSLLSLFVG